MDSKAVCTCTFNCDCNYALRHAMPCENSSLLQSHHYIRISIQPAHWSHGMAGLAIVDMQHELVHLEYSSRVAVEAA